jgi:integrase
MGGNFGGIVRLALLTAQRRAKVAEMRWAEVSEDGAWMIPLEPREKENAGKLLLPDMALSIIRAQPHMGDSPYVFTARRTNRAFSGFGEGKLALDKLLPADIPDWTLHDLRRTARSLMSRAGVDADIAERTLGHAIGGIRGTYDRFAYTDEKAGALARLSRLISDIVELPSDKVVPMAARKSRRQ